MKWGFNIHPEGKPKLCSVIQIFADELALQGTRASVFFVNPLTHCAPNKMAKIFQAFLDAFISENIYVIGNYIQGLSSIVVVYGICGVINHN